MTFDAWSPEKEEILAKMNSEGYSSRAIAAALGPPHTRNSVLGKIHRLGLSGTRPKIPKRSIQRANKLTRMMFKGTVDFRSRKPKLPEVPAPNISCEPTVPEPLYIRLNELMMHHCRYPFGDKEITFCGQPRDGHRSYCRFHSRMCGPRTSVSYG